MITVVGIGNRMRGDDGAGLAVTERLRSAGLPPDVRVIERASEPTELIQEWEGDAEVILVDAVRSGAPAGTVHRIDALEGPLPAPLLHSSSHAFGIAETVELARALGRLPRRMEVFGIEGRDFQNGAPMGAAVERAVERLAAELAERLRTRSNY